MVNTQRHRDPKGWTEYERRFFVTDPSVIEGQSFVNVTQAYLYAREGWAVRVRRVFHYDEQGNVSLNENTLGLKGPRQSGQRKEIEWPIEGEWAWQIFSSAQSKVFKRRYQIVAGKAGTCDLDVFFFDNEGLMIAEFESEHGTPDLIAPEWCGREIVNDPRFDNENLAMRPYMSWPKEERAEVERSMRDR